MKRPARHAAVAAADGASLSARVPTFARLDRPAVVYLVASMLLGVSGQVALKAAVTGLPAATEHAAASAAPLRLLATAVMNPGLWAGLVLYLSGTFFWLLALSRAPLGVLYPFTGLNFVLVLLPSVLLLHERIGPLRAAGVGLIALGVILHARDLRRVERVGENQPSPGERQP